MYKLIVVDHANIESVVFEHNDISELDSFTYQFINKEDLLNQVSRAFNNKFYDVYIKSIFNKKTRYIHDIMYQDYHLPSDYELCDRYSFFLLADRNRIRKSFINYLPNIKNINLKYLSSLEIINTVVKHMNSYRRKRDCYFELVHGGVIRVEEGKIKRKEKDSPIQRLIDDIDTTEGNDEDIIIDKIRDGEIEQDYYDLEEYSRLRTRGHRR